MYLGLDETLQHVDALHDDEGLQHVHLEVQRLDTEAEEIRKRAGEQLTQHLSLLCRTLHQPTLHTNIHVYIRFYRLFDM